ncbi:hypothetical protein MKZ26_18435 [Sporosarcina sp. FSL K6-6792]|uniref:hypothetical protein n=1 Tax=Sporosarcina sp. FSL K6-6792 TaxID=2921559 RepID=UPI0030F95E27
MKKILGIFLVFTLLVGAGTIYASGNPGQNLSEWYKNAFHKESEKLGAATATGMILVLKEVNIFVKESKKSIDDALGSFRDDKVKEAESGIEKYQADTINSLNATVVQLENVNFDDYVDKQNIEAQIDQEFDQMVEDVFSE